MANKWLDSLIGVHDDQGRYKRITQKEALLTCKTGAWCFGLDYFKSYPDIEQGLKECGYIPSFVDSKGNRSHILGAMSHWIKNATL